MALVHLPYNIAAERATLGSALLNRAAAIEVATWLPAAAFYDDNNRAVWAAILAVLARGDAANLISVARQLERDQAFARIGGMEYLDALTDLPPGVYSSGIDEYAHLVEQAYIERQLLLGAQQVGRIAQDTSKDVHQKLADAQQVVAAIQPRQTSGGLLPISTTIAAERTRLGSAQAGIPVAVGVATDYRDLDEITGGLQPSDLIILAARPSVGKTSLALSLAYNIVNRLSPTNADQDVLVFSLEMSRDQLTQRLVAMHTRIDTHRLRTLRLTHEESDEYLRALDALATLPMFIDDAPGIDVAYMRHALYRHIAARGVPAVVMIDYLQLMAGKGENRVQEVSAISRALKALAKEFHVPVLALSQLSRAVEGRTSHVPMLSDLRESGSIEQDADMVMFIYREELYDRDTDKKGIAELHIAKHRNGPIGVVPLRFDAATTRFDTIAYRTPEGY